MNKQKRDRDLSKPIFNDYLKYWRVIRYFIKAKHGLTTADLEMLLFLYSEDLFSKDKFDEFNQLLSWNIHRFEDLRKNEWIETFRKKVGNKRTIYQLSYKAQRVINSIYKKLSGEEIPTSQQINPIFAKNVKYTDKVYRNFIIEMNKTTKQLRHHSPE